MSRTPADEQIARCTNCGGWMVRYNGCHLCRMVVDQELVSMSNWVIINRK